MESAVSARLRPQLGDRETNLLAQVLDDLAERVHGVLSSSLVGVYVKGSFALGSGDVHADVDFLVATRHGLGAEQETAIRRAGTPTRRSRTRGTDLGVIEFLAPLIAQAASVDDPHALP